MEYDELYHYGIKGMKWGIRRTPEQLGHSKKTSKKKSKNTRDEKERQKRKTDLKNRRTLSDEDIKRKIERLKLEAEYKRLVEEDIAPGKAFVKSIAKSSARKYLNNAGAGGMAYTVKLALTRDFDVKDLAAYIASNPNQKKK